MRKLLPVIVLCIASSALTAQSTLYNSGTLYIAGSNDTLYISGGLTNTGTGAFTNNGILQVKQNLANDQASMTAGTGTLYLNGSSTQTVSGTQSFITNNLVTSNAAGITLNNNLRVNAAHSFVNGMITTSATPNYMIYSAGASYTGATDARHVNGWVKKFGNTDFIFPVGSASYLRSVTLGTITASSEFNVKYNTSPTPNRTQLFAPLVLVDTFEYWTISKVSGSAAKVTMNWDKSKVNFPWLNMNYIRAAYYNGTNWINIGGTATGSIFTSGSITSNSVTAISNHFVIGSTAHVLAVSLTGFGVTQWPGYNRAGWEVIQETAVSRYEVQRSDDGIHFYTLSAVQPRNNGADGHYNYDDNKPMTGTTYYRLLIAEQGGGSRYSGVVVIQPGTSGRLYLVQNPVKGHIDLYAGESYKGTYTYVLVSSSAQVVQQGTLVINHAGRYNIALQHKLVAGIYSLVLRKEGEQYQLKMMKE
jgi:hypothetical protein